MYTSESDFHKHEVFFKLRERQSRLLARKNTPVDMRMRDTDACVLTPSVPAERCVGALSVAYWACSTYHLSCGSSSQVALYIPDTLKCLTTCTRYYEPSGGRVYP